MPAVSLRAKISVIAALFLSISSAHAAPVTYDESVSGDLPGINPLTVFTFEAGINTVTGTVTIAPELSGDGDSFGFIVPFGTTLTGGTLSLTRLIGTVTGTSWQLGATTSYDEGTLINFISSSAPGSTTIRALPEGSYHIGGQGIGAISPLPATASYIFTFTVVPEPASLSLLALAAVPMLRRSRSR